MTYKEFNEFRDAFIEEALDISDSKSIEYTISNEDKHYNFKHVADRLGISPSQAMMVYVLKHVDAICNDAKTGKQVSDETVRSRCQDIMNYSILYASLHAEQHTKGNHNDNNIEQNGTRASEDGGRSTSQSKPSKWNELRRDREKLIMTLTALLVRLQ